MEDEKIHACPNDYIVACIERNMLMQLCILNAVSLGRNIIKIKENSY